MSCAKKAVYSLSLAKELITEARKNKQIHKLVDYNIKEYDALNKAFNSDFRNEIEEGLASCLIKCYKKNYLGTKKVTLPKKEILFDCYLVKTGDFDKNDINLVIGFKETAAGTYYIEFIREYSERDTLVKCLKNLKYRR